MANVKPFRGVRPPKEYVEKVASKPYDVLSSEEARAEAGEQREDEQQRKRLFPHLFHGLFSFSSGSA